MAPSFGSVNAEMACDGAVVPFWCAKKQKHRKLNYPQGPFFKFLRPDAIALWPAAEGAESIRNADGKIGHVVKVAFVSMSSVVFQLFSVFLRAVLPSLELLNLLLIWPQRDCKVRSSLSCF